MKPSRSTRRLRSRKAGAALCVLAPLLPIAWHWAHMRSARARPSRSRAPGAFSSAKAAGHAKEHMILAKTTAVVAAFARLARLIPFPPVRGRSRFAGSFGRRSIHPPGAGTRMQDTRAILVDNGKLEMAFERCSIDRLPLHHRKLVAPPASGSLTWIKNRMNRRRVYGAGNEPGRKVFQCRRMPVK